MPNENQNAIALPGTDITTTDIGFGTSGIMGAALTDRGRLKVLDYLYAQGLRHYDTAPLYGMGEAETLVGKFIKNKRHSITVATKYGLNPPPLPWYYKKAAPVARAIYHRSSIAKKSIDALLSLSNRQEKYPHPPSAHSTASSPNTARYTASDMEFRLNESLKKLHTDHIDIYFLHDCSEQMITDSTIRTISGFLEQGKIRSFGLATGRSACKAIVTRFPELKAVMQLSHTIFDDKLSKLHLPDHCLTITHSILNRYLAFLKKHLENPATRERWSKKVDHDLSEPGSVVKFLLSYARSENSQGIVLFSSTKIKNIDQSLQFLTRPGLSKKQIEDFSNLTRNELVILR